MASEQPRRCVLVPATSGSKFEVNVANAHDHRCSGCPSCGGKAMIKEEDGAASNTSSFGSEQIRLHPFVMFKRYHLDQIMTRTMARASWVNFLSNPILTSRTCLILVVRWHVMMNSPILYPTLLCHV